MLSFLAFLGVIISDMPDSLLVLTLLIIIKHYYTVKVLSFPQTQERTRNIKEIAPSLQTTLNSVSASYQWLTACF